MMDLVFWLFYLALLCYAWASPARESRQGDDSRRVTKVVYRDTPVGELTNLPTLPPATYCTQTLANGQELLVTKTGASCPILSASRTSSSSAADVSAPSRPCSPGAPGCAGQGLSSKCSKFQRQVTDADGKMHWIPVDQDTGLEMCTEYCSGKIKDLLDKNQVASSMCVAVENPIHWQDYGLAGWQVALGNCVCNNPLLDQLVHNFTTEILPAIGEVTCKTFVTAISSVINIGLNALPGVGGLIGGAATVAMQAAQTAAWTFENEQDAAGGFKAWLEKPSGAAGPPDNPSTWLPDKICGNKYTPADAEKVFGAFDVASSSIGAGALWKSLPKGMHWPPPFPKGSGSLDDMLGYLDGLKPKPKGGAPKGKPDDPKKPPPKTEAPKSKDPAKSSAAKSCTRKNGRRAPVNKQGDGCDDKVTVTRILNSQTIDKKHTSAALCDWNAWPEACAHYYSAIHADPGKMGKSRFTCEDDNDRVDQTYVGDWYKQHNKIWRAFERPDYIFNGKAQKHEKKDLHCQADEWPPAYFVPEDGKGRLEWGQRIRWIPREENGGAASLWNNFCAKYDGGKGNGQRVKQNDDPDGDGGPDADDLSKAAINKELLEGKKLPPANQRREGKDGTVTEVYNMLTFTRAVFEIQFNFEDKPPSQENEWLLRENPCWPEDIAADDPGFPLLTNDPYYNRNQEAKATAALYARPPSRKRFDEANEVRVKKHGARAKIPDTGVPAADPPPPKAKKPNPPSGARRRRERLELVGGRLHLRDVEFNITRPLTDEEIKENVEITRCADRKCSREQENPRGEEDSLILPGVGRPSKPSENTAIPTLVTRTVTAVADVRRSAPSADLPLATAVMEIS